jgi:hypothetical protein
MGAAMLDVRTIDHNSACADKCIAPYLLSVHLRQRVGWMDYSRPAWVNRPPSLEWVPSDESAEQQHAMAPDLIPLQLGLHL